MSKPPLLGRTYYDLGDPPILGPPLPQAALGDSGCLCVTGQCHLYIYKTVSLAPTAFLSRTLAPVPFSAQTLLTCLKCVEENHQPLLRPVDRHKLPSQYGELVMRKNISGIRLGMDLLGNTCAGQARDVPEASASASSKVPSLTRLAVAGKAPGRRREGSALTAGRPQSVGGKVPG